MTPEVLAQIIHKYKLTAFELTISGGTSRQIAYKLTASGREFQLTELLVDLNDGQILALAFLTWKRVGFTYGGQDEDMKIELTGFMAPKRPGRHPTRVPG